MRRGGAHSTPAPPPPIEARLGAEHGRRVNVSATGALVRTISPASCTLMSAATLLARIVRTGPAKHALAALCGDALTARE